MNNITINKIRKYLMYILLISNFSLAVYNHNLNAAFGWFTAFGYCTISYDYKSKIK